MGAASYGAAWVIEVPAGYTWVTLSNIVYTRNGQPASLPSSEVHFAARQSSPIVIGDNIVGSGFTVTTINSWNTTISQQAYPLDTTKPWWAAVGAFASNDGSECLTFDYAFTPLEATTDYQSNPQPSQSALASAIAPCPTVSTLQDVAQLVCQLQQQIGVVVQQLGYLARLQVPPTYTTDVESQPTDSAVLDKPDNAIGVQVTFTPPPTAGSFGANPITWWDIGWATPVTPDGYLPAVRLHYSPQVLLPLPPQVAQIALDLRPGVSASYKWLRAPK